MIYHHLIDDDTLDEYYVFRS